MRTAIVLATTLLLCVAMPAGRLAAYEDEPAASAEAAAPAEEEAAPAEEKPAEEEAPAGVSDAEMAYAFDNIVLFLSAVLVIFMQPGFAMVEAGFNASKNTVNILFKNVMDLCIGCLLYYVIGYGLMYPGTADQNPYFGFGGFDVSQEAPTPGAGVLNPQVDFLFQVAFAATAATIVSGAVAGRLKFTAYLVYSGILTGLVYPISGFWKWGGGWLDQMGFADFAGSIVVHAVGGFAGLAGAIMLGPRIGRYTPEGKSVPMPGHNLTIATLGVFILWVGWYGFNPGSQLAFAGADNTNATVLIAVNTTLAAAAGGFAAMLLSWVMFKKPDLSMALNGILAGLVGITANCDQVTNVQSMIIGAIAGVLVVMGIIALDKLKIDDPVGAFPVHGICGVWGGIATGIFGSSAELVPQVVGSLVIPVWSFATMMILFGILKAIGMLRVPADEEIEGLDMVEHGMSAYTLDH